MEEEEAAGTAGLFLPPSPRPSPLLPQAKIFQEAGGGGEEEGKNIIPQSSAGVRGGKVRAHARKTQLPLTAKGTVRPQPLNG